jgi:6-pyruvoyltetrahydropterin/6-carboxytetrahydropterin synthase
VTSLTRRYRFASSHRLNSPALTEEQNWETYGKCNNPYGHGHDYVLEVTASGPVNEHTGRVLSVAMLDAYVRNKVLHLFDHRDMNRDIPAFQEKVPTAENIAAVIGNILCGGWQQAFPGTALSRVRIEETRRNFVELRNR